MTEEELTAIEARANAATREPWVVGDAYVPTASLSAVSVYGMGMEVAECQMPADGTFIAAARVDVPALVAEVRRLRAELGAAYGHDYAKANPDAYTALHDALIVAEGQRDQAKMRAEAAESELRAFLAQRSQVISVGAILTEVDALRAERDALRNEWSGLLIEQARLMALRDEAVQKRDDAIAERDEARRACTINLLQQETR